MREIVELVVMGLAGVVLLGVIVVKGKKVWRGIWMGLKSEEAKAGYWVLGFCSLGLLGAWLLFGAVHWFGIKPMERTENIKENARRIALIDDTVNRHESLDTMNITLGLNRDYEIGNLKRRINKLEDRLVFKIETNTVPELPWYNVPTNFYFYPMATNVYESYTNGFRDYGKVELMTDTVTNNYITFDVPQIGIGGITFSPKKKLLSNKYKLEGVKVVTK